MLFNIQFNASSKVLTLNTNCLLYTSGKTYHYDMVLSGWWEASNDSVSVATVSEQFIKENPDVVQNTYAVDQMCIRDSLKAYSRSK